MHTKIVKRNKKIIKKKCDANLGSELKQNAPKSSTTTKNSQKSANFYKYSNASDSLGFANNNVSQITSIHSSYQASISHSSSPSPPYRIYFAGIYVNLIFHIFRSVSVQNGQILIYDARRTLAMKEIDLRWSNQALISNFQCWNGTVSSNLILRLGFHVYVFHLFFVKLLNECDVMWCD